MNVKKKEGGDLQKAFDGENNSEKSTQLFFQMFRSIWVSALEFGRKSTAEVILL